MRYKGVNIKTKLAFQFTLIVFVILCFFASLIYYFTYSSQVKKFRQNLYNRAKNTAVLLINVKEIDAVLLKKIHQSTYYWSEEEIAVLDSRHKIIYSNNLNLMNARLLHEYALSGLTTYFKIGEKDGVIYCHQWQNQKYYVFVTALDRFRRDKLSELLEVTFWSIIFSIWLSVLLAYLLAKKALQPINSVIADINSFERANLSFRLNEGMRKNELEQLAMSFNGLLNELEDVFKRQNQFILNASHEIRSPLSVLITESEYFVKKPHEIEEYIEQIGDTSKELRSINDIVIDLLELARLNSSNTLSKENIRVDELIFQSITALKLKFPGRKIVPQIDYPSSDSEFLIHGHAGLLELAFKNILENACKFSEESILINLKTREDKIFLTFIDQGIGIPEEDLISIFSPFKRGSNVKYKGGFGLGLSLVNSIISIHDARINVQSVLQKGTTVEIIFDKIQ